MRTEIVTANIGVEALETARILRHGALKSPEPPWFTYAAFLLWTASVSSPHAGVTQ